MTKLIIMFISLLLTSMAQANECQILEAGGPTSIRDKNAPWVKAGVDYLKFKPDINNPSDTIKPSATIRDKVIGDTLYIDGEIHPFMAEYFFDGMEGPGKARNIKTVVLNSFGGLAEAGYQVAKIIRERGITTIIPAGGTCASACTIIFQGGLVRKASRNSVMLYHGVRAGRTAMSTIYRRAVEEDGEDEAKKLFFETWYKTASEATALMFSRYEELDASPELEEFYMSLPEDPNYFENGNPLRIQDWRVSACETMKYNLVTELF